MINLAFCCKVNDCSGKCISLRSMDGFCMGRSQWKLDTLYCCLTFVSSRVLFDNWLNGRPVFIKPSSLTWFRVYRRQLTGGCRCCLSLLTGFPSNLPGCPPWGLLMVCLALMWLLASY